MKGQDLYERVCCHFQNTHTHTLAYILNVLDIRRSCWKLPGAGGLKVHVICLGISVCICVFVWVWFNCRINNLNIFTTLEGNWAWKGTQLVVVLLEFLSFSLMAELSTLSLNCIWYSIDRLFSNFAMIALFYFLSCYKPHSSIYRYTVYRPASQCVLVTLVGICKTLKFNYFRRG